MTSSEELRQRSLTAAPMQQVTATAWTGQPYPTYKASGVEWLGQVPKHWEIRMAKRGYDIKLGKMLQTKPNSANDIEVSYLKAKDVQWFSVQPISGARMWASPGDIEQFSVSSGDLLVCEGGEGGRCGILTGEVKGHIIQNSLHRVRSRDGNSNAFLQYTMRAVAETGWFAALNNKATIAHFTYEKFGALRIPFPSSPEQHAIAHFLNHATQRIQHHIHAKEKLIKLLEEQKQVIIHQAVMGQINVQTGQPYPVYKDSGVEWLGEVPEHWEVQRLKYIVSFTGGGTPSKANASFWSGPIPWVSPKDMTRARIDDTTDHISREAVAASAASIVAPGAVLLVVRSGILSRTIPVAINTVPMALNQDMKALRPRNGIIESEYLHGLIEGNQAFLLKEWTKQGATVESIEHCLLANSLIPIPSLPEQHAIAHFLTHTTQRIAKHSAAVKREIELLHEYRTRLIADVVTGKLDVREAAAHLPESDPPALAANCQDGTELAASVRSVHP